MQINLTFFSFYWKSQRIKNVQKFSGILLEFEVMVAWLTHSITKKTH